MTTRASFVCGGVFVGAVIVACGSDRTDFNPNSSGGLAFRDDAGASDSGVAPPCAVTSLTTDKRPLDLFVTLDRSSSMMGPRWDQAKRALKQFFATEPSTATSCAMNYFPTTAPLTGSACDLGAYSVFPVGLVPLPDSKSVLAASLDSSEPVGDTPLGLALDGALRAATAKKAQSPDDQVAVVLVTDGVPTACASFERIGLVDAARDAHVFNGTLTFAVSMSADATAVLSPVAAAGGTGEAIHLTGADQLGDALRRAQTFAIGCEFVVPKSAPDGRQIDPDLVNVVVTDEGGKQRRIPRAASATSCENKEGWIYDDPAKPTLVRLCPASCALLTRATNVPKVDVNFGCRTEVK